jgi:hypothetical protein
VSNGKKRLPTRTHATTTPWRRLTIFTTDPEVSGPRVHQNLEVLGRCAQLDRCNVSNVIRPVQISIWQAQHKFNWTHSMSRPRVLLAVGLLAGVRPPFVAAWMSRGETPDPVLVPEVVALVVEGALMPEVVLVREVYFAA